MFNVMRGGNAGLAVLHDGEYLREPPRWLRFPEK